MPSDPSFIQVCNQAELPLPPSLAGFEKPEHFVQAGSRDFVVQAHSFFERFESLVQSPKGATVQPGEALMSLIERRVCSPQLFWQALDGVHEEIMSPFHGVHTRILSTALEVKAVKEAILHSEDFTIPRWMIVALVSRDFATGSSVESVLSFGQGVQNIVPVKFGNDVSFCILSPAPSKRWSVQSPFNFYGAHSFPPGAVLLFGNPIAQS